MAFTTSLPPQAYTRDTLVKAIEWMSTQPISVRERAKSADLVVSYYLQARRRMNSGQVDTPMSGENFKEDLKHLAQDLKQFDEPSPPTAPAPSRSLSPGPFELPDPNPPPAPAPITYGQPSTSQTAKGLAWHVDARSLTYAREIQERLNLSSEGDAIRMLITLGMERARSLFP